MAGNTGTQSLAVTIRLISDEEVSKKEVLKTIFKEVRIGLMNGSILGVLAFGFVLCFLYFTKQGVTSETFVLTEALKASMIVGVSLLIAMTICSVIGSIIPIIFKKIKIDPAKFIQLVWQIYYTIFFIICKPQISKKQVLNHKKEKLVA